MLSPPRRRLEKTSNKRKKKPQEGYLGTPARLSCPGMTKRHAIGLSHQKQQLERFLPDWCHTKPGPPQVPRGECGDDHGLHNIGLQKNFVRWAFRSPMETMGLEGPGPAWGEHSLADVGSMGDRWGPSSTTDGSLHHPRGERIASWNFLWNLGNPRSTGSTCPGPAGNGPPALPNDSTADGGSTGPCPFRATATRGQNRSFNPFGACRRVRVTQAQTHRSSRPVKCHFHPPTKFFNFPSWFDGKLDGGEPLAIV